MYELPFWYSHIQIVFFSCGFEREHHVFCVLKHLPAAPQGCCVMLSKMHHCMQSILLSKCQLQRSICGQAVHWACSGANVDVLSSYLFLQKCFWSLICCLIWNLRWCVDAGMFPVYWHVHVWLLCSHKLGLIVVASAYMFHLSRQNSCRLVHKL